MYVCVYIFIMYIKYSNCKYKENYSNKSFLRLFWRIANPIAYVQHF